MGKALHSLERYLYDTVGMKSKVWKGIFGLPQYEEHDAPKMALIELVICEKQFFLIL